MEDPLPQSGTSRAYLFTSKVSYLNIRDVRLLVDYSAVACTDRLVFVTVYCHGFRG